MGFDRAAVSQCTEDTKCELHEVRELAWSHEHHAQQESENRGRNLGFEVRCVAFEKDIRRISNAVQTHF